MKLIKLVALVLILLFFSIKILPSTPEFKIELEQINLPGSPAIHSFAFAQANGKWLFIGGRTNGLHGFTPPTAFPKQYSNKNIFVVDPSTSQTWYRNIFTDLPVSKADPLRSTNMEFTQEGNKLYIAGGYGFDSAVNNLITFPKLTVIDVEEIINAIISGQTIAPYVRQLEDNRIQITGGELNKLGEYFYLTGGHKFTGTYRRTANDQVYSNQIKKFKIIDDGINVSISDYTAITDTVNLHRRDMNVVPAIKPDGATPYLILYGGVFRYGQDLPYLNPVYIDENGIAVDNSFEQKMSQYTCALMPAYNSASQTMHTTFFGGTSFYFYNETTNLLQVDSLIPFINDITTISRVNSRASQENILPVTLPALLGTNAEFILNDSVPHFENEVIKLNEISHRTLAGYIYGGIRAVLPNNGTTYPSEYIFKVYITPDFPTPVELVSFSANTSVRSVFLKWSTSSEINNAGFEIERREIETGSQSNWTPVAFIRGYGNSKTVYNYLYEDKDLNSGIYNYRLKQVDYNGNFRYYNLEAEIKIGIPEKFILSQNYPNPFNPVTKINYTLPKAQFIVLKIYDINGNEVDELVNAQQKAGYHSAEFTAGNLPSGTYFCKLESQEFSGVRKMLLIK